MVAPKMQETTTSSVLQLPDFLKVDHAWLLIAVRFVVFVYPTTVAFSEWIPILQSILVDPIFSLHHVQEAVAIRELFSNQFADSYMGSLIHIPPLLLTAVECLVARGTWLLWMVVLLLDMRIAWNLQRLAESSLRHEFDMDTSEDELTAVMDERLRPQLSTVFPTAADDSATMVPRHRIPVWIALLYLTVATLSNPHSFQSIPLFCLMEALVQPSLVSSAAWLALAAYVDVHCSLFLVPLVLLQQRRRSQSVTTTVAAFVLFFTLLLQGCSYLLVGGRLYRQMVLTTHFHSFRLQGMEPSLSVLWYFCMQVFRRFRLYFQLIFGGLPYCIVVPTTIRLYPYPSVLIAIFWFLSVFFRPPLTLVRISVGICFLLLNPRSLARMHTYSLVVLCALPIPITLYLVTFWLWIEPGTGEANFCFFQCLAANIFLAAMFINFFSASLRRDKALRYTRKEQQQQTATNRSDEMETDKKDQ